MSLLHWLVTGTQSRAWVFVVGDFAGLQQRAAREPERTAPRFVDHK
jgi:hypothetical protein